jgi:hypothetical protein
VQVLQLGYRPPRGPSGVQGTLPLELLLKVLPHCQDCVPIKQASYKPATALFSTVVLTAAESARSFAVLLGSFESGWFGLAGRARVLQQAAAAAYQFWSQAADDARISVRPGRSALKICAA